MRGLEREADGKATPLPEYTYSYRCDPPGVYRTSEIKSPGFSGFYPSGPFCPFVVPHGPHDPCGNGTKVVLFYKHFYSQKLGKSDENHRIFIFIFIFFPAFFSNLGPRSPGFFLSAGFVGFACFHGISGGFCGFFSF